MLKITYLKIYRLVFVVFSLYLLRDAFFRWDGFQYYASFSEFVPSVSLAFILWSIVAALVTLIIWLILKVAAWFTGRMGWKFTFESVWMDKVQNLITPIVGLFGILLLLAVPIVTYHTWVKDTYQAKEHEATRASVQDIERPNIIMVIFDALTARDMSVYGYERETTPFISKWAKEAALFTRVEAESNFTTPAATSLMTGKRVWTHLTFHLYGSRPDGNSIENLPRVLRENGYFNMAFIVNPNASLKALGINGSFDIAPFATDFNVPVSFFGWENVKYGVLDIFLYEVFGEKIRLYDWVLKRNFILGRVLEKFSRNFTLTTVPPEKAFKAFLNVLDNNVPKPYFALIHVFPPHDPYLPPEKFMKGNVHSSALRTYKEQIRIKLRSLGYLFRHKPVPEEMQPAIDVLRDYYDEFIRYCDNQFEDFMGELKKRDVLDNTAVIFTSDHGESFEHGYLMHEGPFMYEQVTHVPLIIREPAQTEGQVIEALIEQIDIPATILDLAGIPLPEWMEGRSLKPLMRGSVLSKRLAFAMNLERNPSRGQKITRGTIAVWEGDYKLINYLGMNESLLFNLREDPGELDNLIDRKPEVASSMLGIIRDNLKKANDIITSRD